MLSNIGPATLILIVIVALLLFGPNKLPELGRAFGRTLREFKKGAKDMMDEEDGHPRKEVGGSAANNLETSANGSSTNDQRPTAASDEQRKLPD